MTLKVIRCIRKIVKALKNTSGEFKIIQMCLSFKLSFSTVNYQGNLLL